MNLSHFIYYFIVVSSEKKGPIFIEAHGKCVSDKGSDIAHLYFRREPEFEKLVPCRNFLKHEENKESHVFTIDNTNCIKKKRSQFLSFG